MSQMTPLDDRIGRPFYRDGAAYRLVFDPNTRGLSIEQVASHVAFDRAVALIRSGDLLWTPPATLTPPAADATVDGVREQVELLDAFRRSPACMDSLDWSLRVRVDAQLAVARTWLSRRGLKPGNPPDNQD